VRRPFNHLAGAFDIAPHKVKEMTLGGAKADRGVAGQNGADRQAQRHQQPESQRMYNAEEHIARPLALKFRVGIPPPLKSLPQSVDFFNARREYQHSQMLTADYKRAGLAVVSLVYCILYDDIEVVDGSQTEAGTEIALTTGVGKFLGLGA
jgi:hypothetical protein